jgi:hypothetical protein
MFGPDIIARSLTGAGMIDSSGRAWQYHSRSDRHSKVACWAIVFDFLAACPLLRHHVASRRVAFGINHEMVDFRNARKKNLDVVVCTPGASRPGHSSTGRSLADLAARFGVRLDDAEANVLRTLPPLQEEPVGSVLVALEAKACMTAHQKALPRLYDELNSSHLTIHGATDEAIAAGFAMVNVADTFVSPGRNTDGTSRPDKVNRHRQPRDAGLAIEKIRQIPRRSRTGDTGFDALGILVVDLVNDGSPMSVHLDPPAPVPGDVLHYANLIERLSNLYATRHAHL